MKNLVWAMNMLVSKLVILYILYLQITNRIRLPDLVILLLALTSFVFMYTNKHADHRHFLINKNLLNLLVGLTASYSYVKNVMNF
jgi:hypothetical protein